MGFYVLFTCRVHTHCTEMNEWMKNVIVRKFTRNKINVSILNRQHPNYIFRKCGNFPHVHIPYTNYGRGWHDMTCFFYDQRNFKDDSKSMPEFRNELRRQVPLSVNNESCMVEYRIHFITLFQIYLIVNDDWQQTVQFHTLRKQFTSFTMQSHRKKSNIRFSMHTQN